MGDGLSGPGQPARAARSVYGCTSRMAAKSISPYKKMSAPARFVSVIRGISSGFPRNSQWKVDRKVVWTYNGRAGFQVASE
ncbi:hypothetical protein BGLA2_2180010 [Burkholderia gladioli]|nr:hypothetical protein BGLA2_2180010 [Burkholderia gladioli]